MTKIDKDTKIGENVPREHKVLNTGAKAVGFALGGRKGAQVASRIVKSKPVRNIADKLNPIKKGIQQQDPAQQKVQNTLANKARNVFSNFRRKKKKDEKKEDNPTDSSNQNSDAQNANQQNDNDQTTDEESSDKKEHFKRIKRTIRIIKISIIVGFVTFFLLLIVVVIFGAISLVAPFLIPKEISNSNVTSVVGAETQDNKEERAYYQKLVDKSSEYEKKCGQPLNTTYIHSALIYYYYVSDDDIDYNRMSNMIDTIVSLMTNDDSCFIDYENDGEFYNNLKNSSEFANYYSKVINEGTSLDEILEEVFELSEAISVDEGGSSEFISDNLVVKTTTGDISFKNYLAGVIYANAPVGDLENSEKTKAYTVAYTTNILANANLNTTNQTIAVSNSINYCDLNSNCNGKGTISETAKNSIKSSIDSVYGYILIDANGDINELNTETLSSSSSNSYDKILKDIYKNYTLENIKENTYTDGVNYGSKKVLTSVIFYDQNDYKSVAFCGRSNASIKTSGCGVTAMAIVTSTYENSKSYDPISMMNQAYKWKYCGKGISGTNAGFFKKEAKAMSYKYLHVGKTKKSDLNLVLSHLSQGHLVIVHIGAGHFTSGGHYMVVGGVDPETRKVYIYDPYNKANKSSRKTGNGWYSFNDIIAKEAFGFYIIWKG